MSDDKNELEKLVVKIERETEQFKAKMDDLCKYVDEKCASIEKRFATLMIKAERDKL